jgi:rare lipoprotein A
MKVLRISLLCAAAAFAPAAPAAAQSPGGAEAPPPPTSAGVVTADGQVAISTRSGALLRRAVRFRGSVTAAEAGRTVTVERFDELAQAWLPLATAVVAADGTYLARWRADRVGQHRVRAVLTPTGEATVAAASGELAVTVHRAATATWYGPGFYGRRTACGQRMTPTLLGVAHRKLPCGTQVALLYGGHTITVPVVDRGPFARIATWDLTAATAAALGFEHTDELGTLRLPGV